MATDFPPAAPEIVDPVMALLPAGRFLLVSRIADHCDGVVLAAVTRVSNAPPLLFACLEKGLTLSPMIRDSRRFAVGVLPPEPCAISRLFGRPPAFDEDRFLGLPTISLPSGLRMPSRVLGWLDCEMVRHLDIGGDCEVYIGQVHAAQRVASPAPPTPLRAPPARSGGTRVAPPRSTPRLRSRA